MLLPTRAGASVPLHENSSLCDAGLALLAAYLFTVRAVAVTRVMVLQHSNCASVLVGLVLREEREEKDKEGEHRISVLVSYVMKEERERGRDILEQETE